MAAAFRLAFVIVAASASTSTSITTISYSSSISTWPSAASSFTITAIAFAPALLSSQQRVSASLYWTTSQCLDHREKGALMRCLLRRLQAAPVPSLVAAAALSPRERRCQVQGVLPPNY